VRAPPDGYPLGIGHVGTHVVNGAIFALPFDLLKDLEPVALLPSNSLLIITKKTFPANDLKELIAWLKANPGKASAGTSGAGGGSHVNGVYFQNLTDTRFQFVPYRGTGPALTDLIAGQIDLMFDQASNSLGQVRAGTIKAYAVTAKARLPSAPDIPTVDEAGLPGFYTSTWYGMWAPKGTPKPVMPSSVPPSWSAGRSRRAKAAVTSLNFAARAAGPEALVLTTGRRSRSGGRCHGREHQAGMKVPPCGSNGPCGAMTFLRIAAGCASSCGEGCSRLGVYPSSHHYVTVPPADRPIPWRASSPEPIRARSNIIVEKSPERRDRSGSDASRGRRRKAIRSASGTGAPMWSMARFIRCRTTCCAISSRSCCCKAIP
jgi:hypothetical protein